MTARDGAPEAVTTIVALSIGILTIVAFLAVYGRARGVL